MVEVQRPLTPLQPVGSSAILGGGRPRKVECLRVTRRRCARRSAMPGDAVMRSLCPVGWIVCWMLMSGRLVASGGEPADTSVRGPVGVGRPPTGRPGQLGQAMEGRLGQCQGRRFAFSAGSAGRGDWPLTPLVPEGAQDVSALLFPNDECYPDEGSLNGPLSQNLAGYVHGGGVCVLPMGAAAHCRARCAKWKGQSGFRCGPARLSRNTRLAGRW